MPDNIVITAELKDLISGHLKDITAQVDKLDGSLQSVGQRQQSSGGGGGIMGSVLGANLLTGAITKAVGAVYDFGKESIDAYGRQEQFLVSLKTMFHGNVQEAELLNGQLKKFATETPFELTEIQAATKMMIAYGSSSTSVVDEMRMLGDISSGVGSSLSEVGYLYGTLRTQGRAYTQDIRQFTGRGIPIVKELAKQFGVTDSKVMKFVEDGKVGFKEVEKAFQSMAGEGGQFFNMMKEQSNTLVGKTSNLSDSWDQLKTKIGESQSGILKNTVQWATDMVTQINRSIDANNLINSSTKGLGKSAYGNQGYGLDLDGEYLKDDRHTKAGDITGSQRLEAFAEKIIRMTSGVKGEDARNKQNELVLLSREIRQEYKNGGSSTPFFNSQMAIIGKASEDLNAAAKLWRADLQNKKDNAKNTELQKASSLETVARGNRPTQVNINIENLVREYKPQVQDNGKAIYKVTQEDVAKALLATVNDVSVLQFGQ